MPAWEWYDADRFPAILEGEVVEVKEWDGKYGTYPIVTLIERYGEEKIAFHAVAQEARDQIRKLDPQTGELIGIAYHGKMDIGKGKYLHQFVIERD